MYISMCVLCVCLRCCRVRYDSTYWCFFFFQAEDGIRDLVRSRGLGDVYKRQATHIAHSAVVVAAVDLRAPLRHVEVVVVRTTGHPARVDVDPARAVREDVGRDGADEGFAGDDDGLEGGARTCVGSGGSPRVLSLIHI